MDISIQSENHGSYHKVRVVHHKARNDIRKYGIYSKSAETASVWLQDTVAGLMRGHDPDPKYLIPEMGLYPEI